MTLDVQVPTSEQPAERNAFTDSFLGSVLELCLLVYLKASYQKSDSLRSADLSVESDSPAWVSRRWLVGIAGLLACVMLAVPVDFHLPVEGVIEPVSRARIFAPVSGAVLQAAFQDEQRVDQGDVLVKLSNTDLQLRYETAVGELATAKAELSSLRAGQTQRGADDAGASTSSRQFVLRTKIESLKDHVDLLEHAIESSTVTAPMQGHVSRLGQRDNLLGSSVMQGQWLLDVVDPSGGYEARMELRDVDRVYLTQAMTVAASPDNTERSTDGLPCVFRLRSAPETQRVGVVTELPQYVQWNHRGEGVIRIRVVLQQDSLQQNPTEQMREGATVVGHVVAGKRALGFVWFRPLIEFFRSLGW